MKLSTAKKNLENLIKIWDLATDLEEMPTGDLEDAIGDCIAGMKTQLNWSVVYHLTENNETDEVLFEGSDADCADYIIDHPELKGHCIISPNY
jgi:hypothetical protein